MNGIERAPEIWFPNLGIKIYELDNVAFSLFGMDIYWYGVIICAGIVGGVLILLAELKRTNQDNDAYMDILLWGIIFGVIGARLYYVLFRIEYFSAHPKEIFAMRDGGLAIYGAIIAVVIVAALVSRKRKMNFFLVGDTFLPSIIFGQMLGRWGNFINREAYGGFSDGLFAMRYIASQAKAVPESLMEKSIWAYGVEYIQVHPTFLYESIWNLGIFIVLMIMKKHKKFDGQIMAVYFMGYAAGRIWIEGLRTDQLLLMGTNIPFSQLLSAIILVGGVILLLLRRHNEKKRAE